MPQLTEQVRCSGAGWVVVVGCNRAEATYLQFREGVLIDERTRGFTSAVTGSTLGADHPPPLPTGTCRRTPRRRSGVQPE